MAKQERLSNQSLDKSEKYADTVKAIKKLAVPFQEAILLESEGVSNEQSADLLGLNLQDQESLLEMAQQELQDGIFSSSVPMLPNDEADQYLTVKQIAERIDKTWQWTVRHLSVHKDKVRRVSGHGVVNNVVFPAGIINILGNEPDVLQASNGWVTARQMSDNLGVDFSWVVRRLSQLPFSGELRQSDALHRAITVHYPIEALQHLKRMKEAVTTPPKSGEEFTIGGLANILNRHSFWVNKKLLERELAPSYRLHNSGRVLAYYTPSAFEFLRKEDTRYKELGEWATIPVISDAVGMDREWVIGKIEELGIKGEFREHPNFRRVYISYPRNVIALLGRLTKDHQNPEEGWMTQTAIVEMLGRSHNWVKRRIDRMNPPSKRRRDERGALRVHYPPGFVNALLEVRYEDETGWT